jgi:hypothetical protein
MRDLAAFVSAATFHPHDGRPGLRDEDMNVFKEHRRRGRAPKGTQ